MSSRAIRALRGETAGIPEIPETVSEDEDDDDDEPLVQPATTAFSRMILPDDDDDESSSSSSSSSSDDDEDTAAVRKSDEEVVDVKTEEEEAEESEHQDEEDLDALISEFNEKDTKELTEDTTATTSDSLQSNPFDQILDGFDAKDLDYEYSMRTSLLDSGNEQAAAGATASSSSSSSNRRRQKASLLFGPARDGWVRPPRLVGGGIGMSTYDNDDEDDQQHRRTVPWPYTTETAVKEEDKDDEMNNNTVLAPSQWCTFVHSDSYQRDVNDYHSVIQQSGDLNALVMFIAHHPFVTPALLQLTTVLYQTNHSQEGLAMLRRILWIYESSASIAFGNSIQNRKVRFLDRDRPENSVFFQALFRLIQISNVAGLSRTALAVTRLLLSFDPLRDPMNVLLAMDKYALEVALGSALESQQRKKILGWITDLVESDLIRLWYRETAATYQCDLRNLPNWAYSYALALFYTYQTASYEHGDSSDCAALKEKADTALRAAIGQFPSVVGLLLQRLEVDTTGRSFQRDWVTVLDFATDRSRKLARDWHQKSKTDTVTLSATMQACDLVIRIFVQSCSKLWSDNDVLQWVYDNLKEMNSQAPGGKLPEAPSPAVMRYAGADPADFEDKIQQLPPDANIIDPGLVAHAMIMNTNRPRFLRHMQQQRGGFDPDDVNGGGFLIDEHGNRVPQRRLLGPPTEVVDPDWPVLEVFWRAMLPWNHVEGMPPPRR